MLARCYSSSLGRFMAVDPGNDTQPQNPQSWNKYAYVKNNPISAFDPTGEDSYLCSRPVDNTGVSWAADHAFVVVGATGLGQGGTVRSFGDDGTGHLGEVNSSTSGTSWTTSATTSTTDQADWNSLGTSSPESGVACTQIDAPDPTVASVANGLVSGRQDYSLAPAVEGGANSNSAARAIANRASAAAGNGAVEIPGHRITLGDSAAAESRVPFRPGTPGPQAQPPEAGHVPPNRTLDNR
jgi:hypothetical protein